jgi:hypothetical protein
LNDPWFPTSHHTILNFKLEVNGYDEGKHDMRNKQNNTVRSNIMQPDISIESVQAP